jgi:hypothetical protein
VIEVVIGDVLADPLLAAALQVHDRRGAGEVAVCVVVVLELVALDLDRQCGEGLEVAHRSTLASRSSRAIEGVDRGSEG